MGAVEVWNGFCIAHTEDCSTQIVADRQGFLNRVALPAFNDLKSVASSGDCCLRRQPSCALCPVSTHADKTPRLPEEPTIVTKAASCAFPLQRCHDNEPICLVLPHQCHRRSRRHACEPA
eukprot:2895982-Amphidinium_carterae.1